jgi:hypothetical protein
MRGENMSAHIHTLRNRCAKAIFLFPALLPLCWALAPESKQVSLAQVSGRVICAGKPFSGTIHFLPVDKHGSPAVGHPAVGRVEADGSFQLRTLVDRMRRGAAPGTYRVILDPPLGNKAGSRLDSKDQEPHTSVPVVYVGPDWNDFRFDLR